MRRFRGESHQLVPNVTTEQKRAHCDAGLNGSAHVSIPHDDVYVCNDLLSGMYCLLLTCQRSLAFIHRPLSNLRYDPAEDISSCGPPPPPLEQNSGYTRIAHGVHSEKLFQAIRKQTQCLILLPMRAAQLSPFVICMIACSTIAYLVASKLALKADEAEAARSRIRISLATLRMYEDAWPRAKKILMELKRIAQSILQSATVSPTPSIDSQLLTDETTVTASFFDNEWLCAFENTTS